MTALEHRVRFEDLALLTGMRARRDPYGPLAAPLPAQRTRLLEQARRRLDVELQISGHVDEMELRGQMNDAPASIV
jgi:hypothetical protein